MKLTPIQVIAIAVANNIPLRLFILEPQIPILIDQSPST